MGLTKVGLFVVLATLSTSTAFNTVTPWNQEVVYTWRALVKAGTYFPARFASQFVLHGTVHVQADKNATHVKISDLTYKLYNGPLDHHHEHEAHSVPVPEPVLQDLHQVFKVVHDEHGHAIGIATGHQEREFSRNIKRALASILQVDNVVVKEHYTHPHAFVAHEHSIYGHGDVDYTVTTHRPDLVEVRKTHHMHDSHHLYELFFSNAALGHCEVDFENPIMHDSYKIYWIGKHQEHHHVVKHMEAASVLVYYPHGAQAEGQALITNQTLELHQVVPVQESFHVPQEHYDHDLTYHPFEEEDREALPDVTNGRHVVLFDKLVPQVKEILHEIHQYFHQDHIHTKEPDTKHGQAVNRVQRLLRHFTVEKLKELHDSLTGETLHVFHHILPLVGSRASALFVKDLVVTKAVEEEDAVEMLQHMPEHVVIPCTHLLTELEELIHLKEDVHWNVRRVAILGFATLIHKSHQYYIHHHHHDQGHHAHGPEHDGEEDHHHHQELEQPYEKYVTEYLTKIKNSQDYKVQMAYVFGFFNMKLHSVIKHLIPAFNGEWWHDRHLRLISLIAASSSVMVDSDPDAVIETFWPILMNRQEHTEMRILAYFSIMQTPSIHSSRLMSIAGFMLTEPNEELYHYHYTYVHAMRHSNDPCRHETRVQMAQIMKFTPPPSHGQSTVHLYDYRDATLDLYSGYSGAIEHHFIHTNVSHIHGIFATSQELRVFHQDYTFYLKIHGIQQTHSVTNILTDLLRKRIPKITNNKDIHIEFAVFRRDQVINVFFFDEHNLHELDHILDFFTKDSHSVSKHLLHIGFAKYHKALIPTDLGTPAMWEYVMPVVHHHNISVTKEVVNKVVNIHVHNRHVDWIHHRSGLSFYNPIADVWQGVNTYHTFDSVLPIHLDVTVNMQQQSVQISWQKHDDHLMNVAGLRSHSKQMTFVKDDYGSNVLIQSSPNSKNWQDVTHGKEYRDDYTFIDEDDLNTGHHWHVGAYDCDRHISNGSFHHQMYLFGQPFTKHFDSPWSHLWVSYLNFHQHAVLSPYRGTCGFIVRIEPSHDHVVSNIDLSLRLHQEVTDQDKYHYTAGGKISTRLTYAVKNKEQSLKTWDVNAIVDMNPGHTVNNVKMHLTRIVPGQKDYKICVDGVKKWTQKGVTGHLNIAMSQSPDGKCVKDDTVVDVTMTGKRSHEQEHEHHIYGSCHYVIPYVMHDFHTLQCLASHTSVRHYVYNVKTTNVPTEFKKFFGRLWDRIKGHYISYYTYEDEHTEDIGEHNLKVEMIYPMQHHQVDVHLTTPHHLHELTGVPTDYWRQWGLVPDSLAYSHLFTMAHEYGEVDHCVVHHDHHHLNHHHHVQEVVPNDWTLYVGNDEQNPQEAVFVKHVGNDQIAVKVVSHGHHFEIEPHGEEHQITVDGKEVPAEEHHHHEDWVTFLIFHDEVNHPVAAVLQHSGFHVEYDGHHVVVIVPKEKEEHHWHGHCYTHH